MSDGYVLLVTDRIDGGEAVSKALSVAMDVRILRPGQALVTDLSNAQGVISDINMSQSDSVRALRAAMAARKEAPLMCMLRNDAEQTFLQAKSHGAKACVSAATAPQLVIGKIAGIGIAGLTQVSLVLLPAVLALFLSGQLASTVFGVPDAAPSLGGLSPGLVAVSSSSLR